MLSGVLIFPTSSRDGLSQGHVGATASSFSSSFDYWCGSVTPAGLAPHRGAQSTTGGQEPGIPATCVQGNTLPGDLPAARHPLVDPGLVGLCFSSS